MKKLEYFLKIVRTSIISDKNYLTKKFMKKSNTRQTLIFRKALMKK